MRQGMGAAETAARRNAVGRRRGRFVGDDARQEKQSYRQPAMRQPRTASQETWRVAPKCGLKEG